jgi:hypothetical protein
MCISQDTKIVNLLQWSMNSYLQRLSSNRLHRPRHGYPMIVAVSFFHRRTLVVVMSDYLSFTMSSWWWGVVTYHSRCHHGGEGWLLPPTSWIWLEFPIWAVTFLAKALPMGCGAFLCLSRQVSLLNYMGWKIESSCYYLFLGLSPVQVVNVIMWRFKKRISQSFFPAFH